MNTCNYVRHEQTTTIGILMNLNFSKAYYNPATIFKSIVSVRIRKAKVCCFSVCNVIDTIIWFVNFYIKKNIYSFLPEQIVKGIHPSIISEELFHKVQD